mgnify:CR=1 FL=1
MFSNYTLGFNEIERTQPIYIYNTCQLTEWGIFISSILLSSGAFVAQILAQIQKSKCKTISCLGSSCIREVEP